MVDLTGINKIGAFAAADIDAIPFVAVEREAGDGQRLPLRAGFLDPVIAAARGIATVAHLDTTPSSPTLQAWANMSGPSTSKLSLNWRSVPSMMFFRCVLRS